MWPNPRFPLDLVTFTEEIPNGKLHFLCSDGNENDRNIYAVNLKFHWKFNFYKFISNINQVTCGTKSVKTFVRWENLWSIWFWKAWILSSYLVAQSELLFIRQITFLSFGEIPKYNKKTKYVIVSAITYHQSILLLQFTAIFFCNIYMCVYMDIL